MVLVLNNRTKRSTPSKKSSLIKCTCNTECCNFILTFLIEPGSCFPASIFHEKLSQPAADKMHSLYCPETRRACCKAAQLSHALLKFCL